jgi:3-oxoadipate enol-lactonase
MNRIRVGFLLVSLVFSAVVHAAADDRATFAGHGFAPVADTRLYYEVRGAGEVVVLVHGGATDCRIWDQQFESWAREFRVVRYDVRGYGGSPITDKPYSQAEDLATLMDYLGISRAHVVGLSLGGMVASDFAVTHPDRILSLVLCGPGITGLEMESPEEGARYMLELRAARDSTPDVATRRWLQDPLVAPAMEHPELRERLQRISRENLHSWLNNWALQRVPRPLTAQRLDQIHVPTLLVIGDRDLPSDLSVVDTLAVKVAGARKVVITGAGHMVNMEKPVEFDAAVLGFLRGVSAGKPRR